MRITKVIIKNLFGITELETDGKSKELTGKKGTGKSSFIDGIRLALTNKSNRDYIIRQGTEEGEIIIETDTGLSIDRKRRTSKGDYRSVTSGRNQSMTESSLRDIFTSLQLDPISFMQMTPDEQNRIVLDLIDFKWDMNWIKEQFGEIVPGVNYEQNILNVLYEIQSDDGYYFLTRHDENLCAREKKAIVTEIAESIPEKYNSKKWAEVELGELYKKIERITRDNHDIEKAQVAIKNRDNKIRAFEADKEIEISAIEKETNNIRKNNEIAILHHKQMIEGIEKENSLLEERKIEKINVVRSDYKANISEFEADVKQYSEIAKKKIVKVDSLQEEANHTEKMKSYINEYDRMVALQLEITEHAEESEILTRKIELARTLPGKILETSNIPIDNLTVKDGKALINGLPISNLSDGEKFDLCIELATSNDEELNLLLLDGMEKFDSASREAMYGKLKKKGIQFFATRTDDSAVLTITEL